MRGLNWDLSRLAFRTRHLHHHQDGLAHQLEHRYWVAPQRRVEDEETELAFHRVWLVRELDRLPQPRPRPVLLPRKVAFGIDAAVHDLRRSVEAAS